VLSHNPRGHTLGIIGLGNIGSAIAKKAHAAFGMKIAYYDVSRKTSAQEASLQATFYPTLEGVLEASDCVVLATPATPDGKKVITKERLERFKMGGRFVNIARGALVDEDAVADAVESGRLVGVGLDVHEVEGIETSHSHGA
jgi:lactate dehydrogenase-like 2-hydroxyacid dehydrogenase